MNYADDGTEIGHTRAACHRKEGFPTEAQAWTRLIWLRRYKHNLERVQPYRCTHCVEWHLGNRPTLLATLLARVRSMLRFE